MIVNDRWRRSVLAVLRTDIAEGGRGRVCPECCISNPFDIQMLPKSFYSSSVKWIS